MQNDKQFQEIAEQAIAVAEKHIGKGNMVSSARLCLNDALESLWTGKREYAAARALKSICYSVGAFHPDYQSTKAAVRG